MILNKQGRTLHFWRPRAGAGREPSGDDRTARAKEEGKLARDSNTCSNATGPTGLQFCICITLHLLYIYFYSVRGVLFVFEYSSSSSRMPLAYSFPGAAVITGAGGTGMFEYILPVLLSSMDSISNTISGIGAATARAFAQAGCPKIALTDLNPDSLNQTLDSIRATHPNTELLSQPGNVADEQFVESFMRNVVDTFGRIDYAVNCAGILGEAQRSTEATTQTFDHINNVNYRGTFLCSRAELKQMLKQEPLPSHDADRAPQRGSVVNVASQLGIVGRPSARKCRFPGEEHPANYSVPKPHTVPPKLPS